MIRMPRILNDSFEEVGRLSPSSLSVTMNLTPLSTASMTIAEGAESIKMRQWVEIYGAEGSLGLFRVKSVSKSYGSKETIQLEQALCTLDDGMIILGTDSSGSRITEVTGTMQEVLATLLEYQPVKRWTLGTVELQDGKTYSATADRSTVLESVQDAVKKAYGYYLDCDFSTTPWTLNLRTLPTAVSCECRISRNTESVTVGYDDTDLCTRVHAVALDGGYMDADTVNVWGVVGKALSADDDADATEVKQAAENYLAEYKNPTLTINVSAVRLAELTGEAWDSFSLGERCRIALPDYGTTMDENIITVAYQDLLFAPEKVQLTLSKPSRDSSTLQAKTKQEAKSSGRSSRKASSKSSQLEKEFKIERDKVDLIAYQTQENTEAFNKVELVLDGKDGTGGLIAQVQDAQGAINEASLKIDAMNATLDLKVEKDGVISAINMTSEDITIQAKKINLSGYVTATQLDAVSAKISSLTAGDTEAVLIRSRKVTANTVSAESGMSCVKNGFVYGGKSIGMRAITVSGTTYYVLSANSMW